MGDSHQRRYPELAILPSDADISCATERKSASWRFAPKASVDSTSGVPIACIEGASSETH